VGSQRNDASTQLGFEDPRTVDIDTGDESLVEKLARVPDAPAPLHHMSKDDITKRRVRTCSCTRQR
jgi:hypothetical protein